MILMNSSSSSERILPGRPFNSSRAVCRVHRCMISESSDVLPKRSGPRSTAAALDLQDPSFEGEKRSKVRYLVFFMMFIAVVIAYMDRANFTVSLPLIEKQFGFDKTQMGRILFIWGLAYAIFHLPGGWFADKLGIRRAASFALGWWSIFTILSAVAYGMVSWCVIRGLMGAGEAPIWPINAKATSTWSAPSERARAFTLAGSGQFVGSAFGVFASGWIVYWFGWQWTFIIFVRWGFSGFQSGFSSSATLRNRTPGSTNANSASSRASAARPPRKKRNALSRAGDEEGGRRDADSQRRRRVSHFSRLRRRALHVPELASKLHV